MTTPPWREPRPFGLSLPSHGKGGLHLSDDGAWLMWRHTTSQLGVLEIATGADAYYESSGGYGSDEEVLSADGGTFLQWGATKKAKPKLWRCAAKARFASKTPDLGLTGRVTAGALLPGGGFVCGDSAGGIAVADPRNKVIASLRVPGVTQASILWLGLVRITGDDELLVVGGDNGVSHRGGALHRYSLDGVGDLLRAQRIGESRGS